MLSQVNSLENEIIFSSSDKVKSQQISRALKRGTIKKLAPRLYTSNLIDSPDNIIRRNQYHILSHLFPKAVISHRSALEGAATKDGHIFLSFSYAKKTSLPGLTIHLLKGSKHNDGDTAFMGDLFLASRPRAFLENMQSSRSIPTKSLSKTEIENRLETICRVHGVEELNILRDDARKLAQKLNFKQEFLKLDNIIAAILGTHDSKILDSHTAKARAAGFPYDPYRIELFAALAKQLQTSSFETIPEKLNNRDNLNNFCFFESYFSNYIEGTEFTVEEAEDIIFNHKIIPNRSADSHDILGTFRIISNLSEMNKTPSSVDELTQSLKKRHAILLESRQDKTLGYFKEIENRAGNTTFVSPELIQGTFLKSFGFYKMLNDGISKAIFMMLLISEIHPFLDGNGRVARVMMNSELTHAGEQRIIIPTVYREDYLLTLRRLSREGDPKPYIKMLLHAQKFSGSIDFENYQVALKALQAANAFLEPYEGKLK